MDRNLLAIGFSKPAGRTLPLNLALGRAWIGALLHPCFK